MNRTERPRPIQEVDGYRVIGKRTIVHVLGGEVSVFVQRGAMSGRPWLRFSRKLAQLPCPPDAKLAQYVHAPGFWVSAYKTKTEAVRGDFG